MTLTIPELSLVVLIGPSGCGKSTFARKHFKPTEVLSSDGFRGLVSDDDQSRPDRDFGAHVIRNRRSQLHKSMRGLGREGFRHVHVLKSQEGVGQVVIERQPLWNNRKGDTGPFDIIGDVHGCCDELEPLLQRLGYERPADGPWAHPAGRKALFVGDLVDVGRALSTG